MADTEIPEQLLPVPELDTAEKESNIPTVHLSEITKSPKNESLERLLKTIVILLIIGILSGVVYLAIDLFKTPSLDTTLQNLLSADKSALNLEKLRYETVKLYTENYNRNSFNQKISTIVAVLTILAAIIGLFINLLNSNQEKDKFDKQISENRNALIENLITDRKRLEIDVAINRENLKQERELDRIHIENENRKYRDQRDFEIRRELDQKITQAIRALGSDNDSEKINSFVSLIPYFGEEYSNYHATFYYLFLNNLKVVENKVLKRLLIQLFEEISYVVLRQPKANLEPLMIDFSYTTLSGLNLSDLDLSDADLGFSKMNRVKFSNINLSNFHAYKLHMKEAKLNKVNFINSLVFRSDFYRTKFIDSKLIEAKLKKSSFVQSKFINCKLQSANFENSDLRNAKFLDNSDLRGTIFNSADLQGAIFSHVIVNSVTIKSLLRANNLNSAHFDDDVKSQLADEGSNKSIISLD